MAFEDPYENGIGMAYFTYTICFELTEGYSVSHDLGYINASSADTPKPFNWWKLINWRNEHERLVQTISAWRLVLTTLHRYSFLVA